MSSQPNTKKCLLLFQLLSPPPNKQSNDTHNHQTTDQSASNSPSPHTNASSKLASLLNDPNPPKTYIHRRTDSICFHNVMGVLFLVEMTGSGNRWMDYVYGSGKADDADSLKSLLTNSHPHSHQHSCKFLVFVPYQALQLINPKHVPHMSKGQLITSVKVPSNYQVGSKDSANPHSDSGYVSARVSQSAASSEGERENVDWILDIPQITLSIIIPLRDLHAIEANQKTFGWSSIKLKEQSAENRASAVSGSAKKKSYGPLVFQDGGLQEFLNTLKLHMQFYSVPNNNWIFLKEKSRCLDESVRRMEFDEYFTDVIREEGTMANSSSKGGLMEWGAKISKEVNSIQVGLKKYFGGNSEEKLAKEALKRMRDDKKKEISQTVVNPPDNASDASSDSFEVIEAESREFNVEESNAISIAEFHSNWMDNNGRVLNPDKFREEIFYRGIQEDARPEIWPFLVGFYPWDSTKGQREQLLRDSKTEYDVYKTQWESITHRQAEKHSLYRERKHRIEKDVVRTDRKHPVYKSEDSEYLKILYRVLMSYAFYNYDLGYCQGMGDFLSPLLTVTKDENLTFWCYMYLMDNRAHQNFHKDSKGMESQLQSLVNILYSLDYEFYLYLEARDCLNLFFCFRWVLVNFKREFNYKDIKRIWEAFWSNHMGENLHLFMCYAILSMHREEFMKNEMGFDDILKYCINLSMNMDAKKVMERTLLAMREFKNMGGV